MATEIDLRDCKADFRRSTAQLHNRGKVGKPAVHRKTIQAT